MTLFKNGHKGLKGLKLFSKPSKPFWSTRGHGIIISKDTMHEMTFAFILEYS